MYSSIAYHYMSNSDAIWYCPSVFYISNRVGRSADFMPPLQCLFIIIISIPKKNTLKLVHAVLNTTVVRRSSQESAPLDPLKIVAFSKALPAGRLICWRRQLLSGWEPASLTMSPNKDLERGQSGSGGGDGGDETQALLLREQHEERIAAVLARLAVYQEEEDKLAKKYREEKEKREKAGHQHLAEKNRQKKEKRVKLRTLFGQV